MKKVTVAQATIAFGTLLVLLLAAGFLLPGLKKEERVKAAKRAEPAPSQLLEGVRLDGGEPGRSKWSLSAKRAEADASGELGSLYEVSLSLTSKDGVVQGEAGKAQKLSAAGSYLLSGGVTVKRGDWSVKTESLRFDQATGKLNGDEPVALSTGRLDLTGSGFEADVNESRVRIKGPTHAVIKGAPK